MGCVYVAHLTLANSRFCVLCARMNYLEAFMRSSKSVNSKVLKIIIQSEYFFLIKRQNGEYCFNNFSWFLFGMSPDIPAFRVCVFTSDFKF